MKISKRFSKTLDAKRFLAAISGGAAIAGNMGNRVALTSLEIMPRVWTQ
jgi:hypothetical protein